jgi:epoxyqueuosine reductase QueG
MRGTETMKAREEIDSSTVKRYGKDAGAAVVGIAASKDLISAPEGFRPNDVLDGCISVIVLGVPFPKEALTDDTVDYTDVRNAMASGMTDMSKEVAKRIKGDGYRTKAISSLGGKFTKEGQFGTISLKHAAESAGLGRMNRNNLLTNDQYGNLLWFSAVLTDADLVPDPKAGYKVCDNCNKCVEACPVGSLDDPDAFKKKECPNFFFKMVDGKWKIRCYRCRSACPYCFGK